jgi:DNA-binding NarL/FixJ family response regulator
MAGRSYIMARLSDRERIILSLSLNGVPDRCIADALNTSSGTIKVSRLRALRRLTGQCQEDAGVQPAQEL